MILALLNEGNDEGAHEAVRELFPHASEEEISSVTLEIQREWDEATDEPPVFIVDEDDNEL
jgi:hypothetical protein